MTLTHPPTSYCLSSSSGISTPRGRNCHMARTEMLAFSVLLINACCMNEYIRGTRRAKDPNADDSADCVTLRPEGGNGHHNQLVLLLGTFLCIHGSSASLCSCPGHTDRLQVAPLCHIWSAASQESLLSLSNYLKSQLQVKF